MAIVQQAICLLAHKVEVDVLGCALNNARRKDATELAVEAGDVGLHGMTKP
jgi:hypothetical protein